LGGPAILISFRDQLETVGPEDDDLRGARLTTVEAIYSFWLAYFLESLPGEYRDKPAAPMPTGYIPGTAAKIEVMRRRVAEGFSPLHKDDSPELAGIGITLEVGRNGRPSIGGFAAMLGPRPRPAPDDDTGRKLA
jgi:hypothetical protein